MLLAETMWPCSGFCPADQQLLLCVQCASVQARTGALTAWDGAQSWVCQILLAQRPYH